MVVNFSSDCTLVSSCRRYKLKDNMMLFLIIKLASWKKKNGSTERLKQCANFTI